MKKSLFILSFLFVATCVMAQVNPERGFIITNANDTVWGTLDMRTAERNCRECTFKADGEEAFTHYQPGEIKAFRFSGNGKFYTSHEVVDNNKRKLAFVEYMVKGELNLYYYAGDYSNIYFFENEEGRIAKYVVSNYMEQTQQNKKENQATLRELMGVIRKSTSAVQLVEERTMSRNRLIQIARTYHDDVCTSNEDCIQYEYSTKSEKATVKFRVFAGYEYRISYALTGFVTDLNETISCSTPFAGVGVEVPLARINPAMMFQGELTYSQVKIAYNIPTDLTHYKTEKVCSHMIGLNAGVGYKFNNAGKLRPIIRGGGLVDFVFNRAGAEDLGSTGFYVGTGVEYAFGRRAITLNVDYRHNIIFNSNSNVIATIGFTI